MNKCNKYSVTLNTTYKSRWNFDNFIKFFVPISSRIKEDKLV